MDLRGLGWGAHLPMFVLAHIRFREFVPRPLPFAACSHTGDGQAPQARNANRSHHSVRVEPGTGRIVRSTSNAPTATLRHAGSHAARTVGGAAIRLRSTGPRKSHSLGDRNSATIVVAALGSKIRAWREVDRWSRIAAGAAYDGLQKKVTEKVHPRAHKHEPLGDDGPIDSAQPADADVLDAASSQPQQTLVGKQQCGARACPTQCPTQCSTNKHSAF